MAKKTVEKEQRDSMSFEEQGGAARQDVTNSSGRNLEVVSEGAHSLKDKRTQRKKNGNIAYCVQQNNVEMTQM